MEIMFVRFFFQYNAVPPAKLCKGFLIAHQETIFNTVFFLKKELLLIANKLYFLIVS